MKVITTKNVDTREIMDLCQHHFDENVNGDSQITRGLHEGTCDACADEKEELPRGKRYL